MMSSARSGRPASSAHFAAATRCTMLSLISAASRCRCDAASSRRRAASDRRSLSAASPSRPPSRTRARLCHPSAADNSRRPRHPHGQENNPRTPATTPTRSPKATASNAIGRQNSKLIGPRPLLNQAQCEHACVQQGGNGNGDCWATGEPGSQAGRHRPGGRIGRRTSERRHALRLSPPSCSPQPAPIPPRLLQPA